ncbi:hypothetical protein Tco_0059998, partial [Tanacetum coccineum]
ELPGAYSEYSAANAYPNCEAVTCEQFETASALTMYDALVKLAKLYSIVMKLICYSTLNVYIILQYQLLLAHGISDNHFENAHIILQLLPAPACKRNVRYSLRFFMLASTSKNLIMHYNSSAHSFVFIMDTDFLPSRGDDLQTKCLIELMEIRNIVCMALLISLVTRLKR